MTIFVGFFFLFPESKFYTIYNGENYFQIRGLVAELHVFEHGGTTVGTFGKQTNKQTKNPCFKC